MIVMWQGDFPPDTWQVFPLFDRVLNKFFADFLMLSVCHQWRLVQKEISQAEMNAESFEHSYFR